MTALRRSSLPCSPSSWLWKGYLSWWPRASPVKPAVLDKQGLRSAGAEWRVVWGGSAGEGGGGSGLPWGPLHFPQASCTQRAKRTPDRPGANLPCSSVAGKQNLATCIRRSWPWVVSQFSPPSEGKLLLLKNPFLKTIKNKQTKKNNQAAKVDVCPRECIV